MPECLVDTAARPVESGLKTWGELLGALDVELGSGGRLVTAVRFDGVDQPSFRDLQATGEPLAELDRIEIETRSPRELFEGTLGTARESVSALVSGAGVVAGAFRGRDMARANGKLAELIEAVRSLATLTAVIGGTVGLELEALANRPDPAGAAIGEVSASLDRLALWQRERDWIATADCLEYELAPALGGWRRVLDAIEEGGAR